MVVADTISIGNLITLGVMIIGAITAFVTMKMTVKANNAAIDGLSKTLTTLSTAHDATSKRVEEVRSKSAHELAEMRLDIAKNYATSAHLQGVESRIHESVKALESRFDEFGRDLRKMLPVVKGRE